MNRTEYLEQQTKRRESRRPKPGLRPKSKKRVEEQKEYVEIVKEVIAEDVRCRIQSPVCTGFAQGLNHRQKRSPKNFLDKNNLEGCCNLCNLYIEEHIQFAKDNGHHVSRFKK